MRRNDYGAAARDGPAAGFVERVWKTVDQLNATLGRGTVRVLSAGPKDAAWKLRAEYRSPRWTTRWEELPVVRAREAKHVFRPRFGKRNLCLGELLIPRRRSATRVILELPDARVKGIL
ncbi:MAG: DUF4113 domain-containing protein [Janthinobacterium lividum]